MSTINENVAITDIAAGSSKSNSKILGIDSTGATVLLPADLFVPTSLKFAAPVSYSAMTPLLTGTTAILFFVLADEAFGGGLPGMYLYYANNLLRIVIQQTS